MLDAHRHDGNIFCTKYLYEHIKHIIKPISLTVLSVFNWWSILVSICKYYDTNGIVHHYELWLCDCLAYRLLPGVTSVWLVTTRLLKVRHFQTNLTSGECYHQNLNITRQLYFCQSAITRFLYRPNYVFTVKNQLEHHY